MEHYYSHREGRKMTGETTPTFSCSLLPRRGLLCTSRDQLSMGQIKDVRASDVCLSDVCHAHHHLTTSKSSANHHLNHRLII